MISIDLNHAKSILKDNIRRDRQSILEKLDIDYIRSLETSNHAQQQYIIDLKNKLRDATKDPRIDNAKTIDELEQIDPIKELGY